MRLITCLLSKVYRKMQIAYDESRYYNIGALGTNSRICSACDISPLVMFILEITQLSGQDVCCGQQTQKL